MIYVIVYLLAIVIANLTVAAFGPSVVIFNAFFLIGLDLTARDKLHEQWHNNHLVPKMFLLIAAGSLISWLLNQEVARIALASMLAFSAAATIDAIFYQLLFKKHRLVKMNGSNIPSAFVDSIIFPTVAFGVFLPAIIIGQFLAKVLGGFFWSLIISKRSNKKLQQVES